MSASAATTIYGPQRAPSARRVRITRSIALAALVFLAAMCAVLIGNSSRHPTMIQVVTRAQEPTSLGGTVAAVDGIAFPDWSRWGWSAAGSRTDRLVHGRIEATTRYTRGDEVVTFSVLSGVDNVDDEALWPRSTIVTRGAARFELLESTAHVRTPPVNGNYTEGTVVTLKRHVRGRTVVLTGTPASQGMRSQLRRLALRGVPAQQREHSLN